MENSGKSSPSRCFGLQQPPAGRAVEHPERLLQEPGEGFNPLMFGAELLHLTAESPGLPKHGINHDPDAPWCWNIYLHLPQK
jgi:hypothetical protein